MPRLFAKRSDSFQDPQHIAEVNQILKKVGIVVIDLNFPDANSSYLSELILGLGRDHGHGPPIEHSSSRGWYWDVRPMAESLNRARSETCDVFPWHTDCSYESRPPQFFGLHVLQADQCGGGTLSVLNVSRLLHRLDDSAYESLSRPDFRITVPQEFFKGTDTINGNVVTEDENRGGTCIRYRSDIIRPLSSSAERALEALNALLASSAEATVKDIRIDMTSQDLPNNSIVLIDNGRWLHARTEIKDLGRHLRRVRWGRRDFKS
ncbi:hypothetical protein ACLMJK_009457 [Lecanora helva]